MPFHSMCSADMTAARDNNPPIPKPPPAFTPGIIPWEGQTLLGGRWGNTETRRQDEGAARSTRHEAAAAEEEGVRIAAGKSCL